MLGFVAKRIFGTRNERVIRSIQPVVARINDMERDLKGLSDQDLRARTEQYRLRHSKGESLDSLLPEAFAVVREAGLRSLGMRHFDVQLVGGVVLHQGKISEMKTGEGKTLVATLSAYLNALAGRGVHIVTVNDYLAKRDSEWMGRLYRFLGLSVGVVYSGMDEESKRDAYRCDITYGQNNEFGFDYLRDNMKFSAEDTFQRKHYYAIVDEVDSILIDEARTPLIISGPAEESTDKYYEINKIVPFLEKGKHFEMDLRSKQPSLTEDGVMRCEELLKVENLYDPNNIETLHHVVQGLRAHTVMERDVDYVVKDGQVIIVDEFTGRLMPGRRWSNGLHQAVEAKEGLKIARENQTLASITFQNYFRMYEKLAGMTGTADTEAVEFQKIYNLEVVVVPPNRPMIREDVSDQVFRTRKEKYEAVVNDIAEIHKTGQPALVGTISIEQSETLSRLLRQKSVAHNVLNAKQHEREAEIVAQAGRFGSVTISTNMAGRGTDIILGGNAEFLAQAEAKTKDRDNPDYQKSLEKFKQLCKEEREKVLAAGGLMILGTERHESRRIDNQLRGRAGRQGDPGKSRFYVSLEDDLMMRFGGDRIQSLMTRLGWEEGIAIDGTLISRSIESAQKRVEAYHFEARKHVTEYDDVMNKQRQVIYNLRNRILAEEGVRDEVLEMLDDMLEALVLEVCDEKIRPINWNIKLLEERASFLSHDKYELRKDVELKPQAIFDTLRRDFRERYEKRAETIGEKLKVLDELCNREDSPMRIRISRDENKPLNFATIEQDTFLETLDHLWNQHLHEMDHLREGIGLRGYGQKNPLHEYQKEGFSMFQHLLDNLKESVIRKLFYYEVPEPQVLMQHLEAERRRREELERRMTLVHDSTLEGEGDKQPAGARASSPQSKSGVEARDPEAERAKLEAQRRARRKAKR